MKKILFLLLVFNCAFGEEIYASFNVETMKVAEIISSDPLITA